MIFGVCLGTQLPGSVGRELVISAPILLQTWPYAQWPQAEYPDHQDVDLTGQEDDSSAVLTKLTGSRAGAPFQLPIWALQQESLAFGGLAFGLCVAIDEELGRQ